MKITKIQTAPKTYNGIPYTEYKIYANQNGQFVIVTCTGKTPTFLIDAETGDQIANGQGPLSQMPVRAGDNIVVWRNEANGRVHQIDVLVEPEVPLQ